jgi:ribosomal protein L34
LPTKARTFKPPTLPERRDVGFASRLEINFDAGSRISAARG